MAISSVSRNLDSFWQLQKGALVCSLFWTSTTVLQRVSGFMLMHSGRSFYPLTAAWGLACTGASLLVANRGANLAFPEPSKSWGDSLLSWLGSKEKMQRYEEIRAALVGVGVYSALERRSFRTAIPSSVISVVCLLTRLGTGPRGSRVSLLLPGKLLRLANDLQCRS